jgi:hypothetical protein
MDFVVEIREGLSLFNDAFSLHQQIPEFQIDSTSYQQLFERINNVKHPLILFAYIDTSTWDTNSTNESNRTVGDESKLYFIDHQNTQLFQIYASLFDFT